MGIPIRHVPIAAILAALMLAPAAGPLSCFVLPVVLPVVALMAWLVGAAVWAARRLPAVDRACRGVAPAVGAALAAGMLCWSAFRFATVYDPASDPDPDGFGPHPGLVVISALAALMIPFLVPRRDPTETTASQCREQVP